MKSTNLVIYAIMCLALCFNVCLGQIEGTENIHPMAFQKEKAFAFLWHREYLSRDCDGDCKPKLYDEPEEP